MIGTVRTAVAAPPLCLWLGCVKFFKMIGRMPDLGVSQKGCQISRCPSLGMFGSVWECLGVFGSVKALGISRAAVVRFAERLRGCALYHPSPNWFQTGFKPVSNRFQTGSKLVSNRLQTGFKPVSNQYQNGFKPVSNRFQTGFKPI